MGTDQKFVSSIFLVNVRLFRLLVFNLDLFSQQKQVFAAENGTSTVPIDFTVYLSRLRSRVTGFSSRRNYCIVVSIALRVFKAHTTLHESLHHKMTHDGSRLSNS